MLPADQGLGADHFAGLHVDLGLVIQQKLVPAQGETNALQAIVLDLDGIVLGNIEQMVAVLASLLGGVHGLVRVAHQYIRIRAVLRVERDTHAGRDLQACLTGDHGVGDCDQHALQYPLTILCLFQVDQYRHKLVAAYAREGVAFAQCRFHALRYGDQQFIAHAMSMGVVYFLEAVQIQKHHRQRIVASLALQQGPLQSVGQQDPVGQVGQGIVVGNVLQPLLVLLHGCDVGEQGDEVLCFARGIADGTDGLHFGKNLAVLASIPDFAVPVFLFAETLPHGCVVLRRVPA